MTSAPPQTQALSPNHGGPRAATLGVVLHSTRGGAISPEAEFHSTINWFQNPAPGGDPKRAVSAHVVIGVDGTICVVIEDELEAWHAQDLNRTHLGAELVQPTHGDPISDAQYSSLAWWLRQMAEKYGFALTDATLPEHWQTVMGAAEGKTDIQAPFDKQRLLEMLP